MIPPRIFMQVIKNKKYTVYFFAPLLFMSCLSVNLRADVSDTERQFLDQELYALNDAINKEPKLASPYISRGLIFIRRSEFDRAIVDFNNALRSSPNLPVAYYCRGLAHAGKNALDEAIGDFTKAIELESDMGGAYYNRAIAYFGKKNYEAAYADLQSAKNLKVEIEPEFEAQLQSHLPPTPPQQA